MYRILNVTTGEFIRREFILSPGGGYHMYKDPSTHDCSGRNHYLIRFFTKLGAHYVIWRHFRKTRALYTVVKDV